MYATNGMARVDLSPVENERQVRTPSTHSKQTEQADRETTIADTEIDRTDIDMI